MQTDLPDGVVIRVNDGDVFEGEASHWADCFFDNVFRSCIEDFCAANGWFVEFIEKTDA